MAKTRFAPDRGLTSRMVLVMFLIGLLAVAFVGALIAFVPGNILPLVLILAGGVLFAQFFFSDKIAAFAMGAREVTPEQAPELHAMIDRLCALADMPKPRVAVSDTDMPNAFATGRSPKNAVICVTTGLMRRLDEPELEGVVAHELSHVAHGDAMVMTVASFVGVLAGLTAQVGARLMLIAGRMRGLWQFLVIAIAVTLLATATWIVSVLLIRALSRYREFAADQAAAQLTGNPAALSSALAKVADRGSGLIPSQDLRRATTLNAVAFCPVGNPKQAGSRMLSTHPSVEARIERLERIARQLG